ncbi:MAG: GNAT family N-acetyltransferase [Victivallaceae bacterium]|nr:GNAT family N-acetyltransferase [Victivallaceae bacterium]
MIIRAMTVYDIDQALALWRHAFKAGFSSAFDTHEIIERYLERNPELSTVAEDEKGRVVGALMCGHDGRRGSIYHTAVSPEMRRRGVGKQMQERSLAELAKLGIHTGFLFISIQNPGSREFWTGTGWEVVDEIKYLYKEF